MYEQHAHNHSPPAPPPRGTREYYIHKRRLRDQGRRGGRIAKFRLIARYKRLTIEQTLRGELDPVFLSEYRWYLWNADPVLCVYCNTRLTKKTRTRDHLVPRSRGGGPRDNLVPSCADCNRDKADDPLIFYMLRRERC